MDDVSKKKKTASQTNARLRGSWSIFQLCRTQI